MTVYTSADLARMFACDKRTIREKAKALGLGMALGGRAGYRYTDEDVTRLRESLRPEPAVKPRRRRTA